MIMCRQFVYWCRENNRYRMLKVFVRIECVLRFRFSEKMLDSWYKNIGRTIPDVRSMMRELQARPDWEKLPIEDKRDLYSMVMYYI